MRGDSSQHSSGLLHGGVRSLLADVAARGRVLRRAPQLRRPGPEVQLPGADRAPPELQPQRRALGAFSPQGPTPLVTLRLARRPGVFSYRLTRPLVCPLQVTDANTARVLQYVPSAPAVCATLPCAPPANVPSDGEYRVLTVDGSLEEFRLYGTIATGKTDFTAKFLYAVTSDTADHQIYRINTLTDTTDSKSLISFPIGWTQLPTHTATKWRYSIPVASEASHPCRCTSSDTDWKQGSGLPWQWDTGTTLIDGAARFETAYPGLAMTLTKSTGTGATPWVGDLQNFCDGTADADTGVVPAATADSGCGLADQTSFLASNTVGYYPLMEEIGTSTNAFCAVLEPRLCSLPSQTDTLGPTRQAVYVDMCLGATATEEPENDQSVNSNTGTECIVAGCCSCDYGLCGAALTDNRASFQLDFEDGWAIPGWEGIQLAAYTAASPRPDATVLATSANDAQRMYAVMSTYGIVKYDLAADGTPTFVGTVLQCEDHKGRRMQGKLSKLTSDSPGGNGHAEGMFAVCNRRGSTEPDASYIFYCALDVTPDNTWREQGRCAYVAGLVFGTADAPSPNLNTEAVRDLIILNAIASGSTITYDIATVEKSTPDSKMYRYSVPVTHGLVTASPTIGTVSGSAGNNPIEFLDGTSSTNSASFQALKTATGRSAFDFFAATVEPDSARPALLPKPPPSNLYLTDFSFNAIIKVPYTASGPATVASASMFGTKSGMVPVGVPMFVDGPVGAKSAVDGIRDSVAGHTVYLKVTANNFAGNPNNEDANQAAHIEVAVTGQVSIGGQDVTIVIPGTVAARSEDIYTSGCDGVCPQNVFWVYYSASSAGTFSVSVTMGPFNDHVVGSPQDVIIAPTEIDPYRTLISRDGAANVRAGNTATIFISTYDRFGNKRTVGPQASEQFKWSLKNTPVSMNVIGREDTYDITAVATNAAVAIGSSDIRSQCERGLPNAAAPTGALTPYWQGEADYRAYRAGTYQFQVILEVANAAAYNVYVDTVVVTAATIDRAKCRADSPDFSTLANPDVDVVISTAVTVEITPRDRYSNPVTDAQTFMIDRQAATYQTLGPQPLECLMNAVTSIYECYAGWDEQSAELYTVKFYLVDPASATTLDGLTGTELEALEPSPLIGTGWADGGGGTSVINAVSKDGASIVCESLENVRAFIQLLTAFVVCIGLGLSVWLSMARTSSFIQMTSPVLGQVIIWGGLFHLFSVLLWTIDPDESGWASDGFNFCSLRMWIFCMSFAMIWGTLALKTYRVKELVLQQSASASGYREISDGKLLAYAMVLVFMEMMLCSFYSFYGDGPVYVLTPCGATLCGSINAHVGGQDVFFIFVAMMAVLNGAIVVFAITQAVQTRNVIGKAGGGDGDNAASAQNSAAAFVEAPHIGFSIYNMAFTSIVLYPVCGLIDYDRSPVAYEVLRAMASIWSCFIVYIFVFGFKVRDKNKFDVQEKINRSQKMMAHQQQRPAGSSHPQQQQQGGGGSYSVGGTHQMRWRPGSAARTVAAAWWWRTAAWWRSAR